ncbi:MAG: alpha/beta fold hydrolase [Kiritimatiellae bacterium]|nr:alpha/beta fold hydrolase [Kiritimatiellia bacterium]
MKKTIAVICAAIAAAAACAAERNHVVFLHGYNSDSSVWGQIKTLLKSNAGYGADELVAFSYSSLGCSNDTPIETVASLAARELREEYENSGRPVDVVCHSMGGLVVRCMVAKGYLAAGKIGKYITLGTPHYGQNLESGNTLGFAGYQANQMKYASQFLWELADAWHFKGTKISKTLCIAGDYSTKNGSRWDGLVHVWSAALGDEKCLYAAKCHSPALSENTKSSTGSGAVIGGLLGGLLTGGLGGLLIGGLIGGGTGYATADPTDSLYQCSGGADDVVFKSIKAFLLDESKLYQHAPDGRVLAQGGIFLQICDKNGKAVYFPSSKSALVHTYYNTDQQKRIIADYLEHGKNDTESQKIGVELVYGTLPEGNYDLTAYASDTTDAFTQKGVYVTGGRMKVIKLSAPDKSAPYSIYFYANGGTGSVTRDVAKGSTLGTLPTPTRSGYKFAGWYTSATGGVKITASTVPSASTTYYARWEANTYSIYFYANGGTGSVTRDVTKGSTLGTLPTPTRSGYTFAGWYTSATGGTKISASTVPTYSATYYAHWTYNYTYYCTLSFNANGGSVATTSRSVVYGAYAGALPTPTRSGYTFDGWYTSASGGTKVSQYTAIYSNTTFYAHWTASGISSASGALFPADSSRWDAHEAATFDAYLYDSSGNMKGSLTIKLSKAAKSGIAKATASAQVSGEGKYSYKGTAENGALRATSAQSKRILAVTLGEKGIAGTLGELQVAGARNLWAGKSAADKSAAAANLKAVPAAFNIVWPDGSRYASCTVSIGAKGKTKVSGTLANGTKVSATAQLVAGADYAVIPVTLTKAASFNIILKGSKIEVPGIPGAVAGVPKLTKSSYSFVAVTSPQLKMTLHATNGKLTVPSTTVLKIKGIRIVDPSINPNKLKLTYTAKNGSFKGSFVIYETVNGKQKKRTVSFTGVMVGDTGYGTVKLSATSFAAISIK